MEAKKNKESFVLPGRISTKEQCWSTQIMAERYSSSMLATDTVVLYEFKSGSKIRPS